MMEVKVSDLKVVMCDWFYVCGVWVFILIWNVLLGRVFKVCSWWNEVDLVVVLGVFFFVFDVLWMKKLGVIGIINICEEYWGFVKRYEVENIE